MNETDLITKIILGTAVQKDFEAVSPYLEELLSIMQSVNHYKVLSYFNIKIGRLAVEEDLLDVIEAPSHRYDLIMGQGDAYIVIKRTFI